MRTSAPNLGPRSMQGLPPSRRRGPAKGLVIGVEVVQPAGFGARSFNLPDAGSRRTSSGQRNFTRGGQCGASAVDQQCGASAVDQQRAQIAISAFADAE